MATKNLPDYLAAADYYLVPVDDYERGVSGAVAGPCRIGGMLTVENWSGMVKVVAVVDGARVYETRGAWNGLPVTPRDSVTPQPPKLSVCDRVWKWLGNA